ATRSPTTSRHCATITTKDSAIENRAKSRHRGTLGTKDSAIGNRAKSRHSGSLDTKDSAIGNRAKSRHRGSLDTKDSAIGNRAGSRHSSAASFREGPAFSIAHAHFVGSRHGNRRWAIAIAKNHGRSPRPPARLKTHGSQQSS